MDQALIHEWVRYAQDDELNARAILKDLDGTPANVCFLSQQMVEKYLKALLLLHTGDYPKTHDLQQLVTLLKPYETTINELEPVAMLLKAYYVVTRYPADVPLETFTWPMAKEALAAAEQIKQFAQTRLIK